MMKRMILTVTICFVPAFGFAQVHDPGVRSSSSGAGNPIAGLNTAENKLFTDGLAAFTQSETVPEGLGPRFNLDNCSGCHIQPSIGGSSPAKNPEFAMASSLGATNKLPLFITLNGPVREARFKFQVGNMAFMDRDRGPLPDGGVHALFTVTGRTDAKGCSLAQEDFDGQFQAGNIALRIPTPVFGGGLIESVTDATILANQAANLQRKKALGIQGHPNRNGNDGTITRFGWKAQNKSLLVFSGEAYNVEMGVTNDLFAQEREEDSKCQLAPTPNSSIMSAHNESPEFDDMELFAVFMAFLDQPKPSTSSPGGADSITRGQGAFNRVGCAMCHTPVLTTQSKAASTALSNIKAALFSDLLVHHMGPRLADDITQGEAAGDEFRTAPLWGVGQRLFFLHDGRSSDLLQVIMAHSSAGNGKYGPSEANATVSAFSALPVANRQDLLNFLRSL